MFSKTSILLHEPYPQTSRKPIRVPVDLSATLSTDPVRCSFFFNEKIKFHISFYFLSLFACFDFVVTKKKKNISICRGRGLDGVYKVCENCSFL